MDRRARLFSDLRRGKAASDGFDSGIGFRDVSVSDLEIRFAPRRNYHEAIFDGESTNARPVLVCSDDESMETARLAEGQDDKSDFLDATDSDDGDIDEHLKLLWPRELEHLGIAALQVRQYDAAAKYFTTASLEWNETLVKRLARGAFLEVRLKCRSALKLYCSCSNLHIIMTCSCTAAGMHAHHVGSTEALICCSWTEKHWQTAGS